MRLGLLILGAACTALAGCSVAIKWPPRDPVEGFEVSPGDCDVQNKQVIDCFDHVQFLAREGVLVMQPPVCADVTVRRWSDKLPNGVATSFYGRPAYNTVIGMARDRAVVIQCIQHPLRYRVPGRPTWTQIGRVEDTLHPNGQSHDPLPRAEGVTVTANPDDNIYSDKYVPEP